jgi:hypothetical protein
MRLMTWRAYHISPYTLALVRAVAADPRVATVLLFHAGGAIETGGGGSGAVAEAGVVTNVQRAPRRFAWRALTNPLLHFKRTDPKVCTG